MNLLGEKISEGISLFTAIKNRSILFEESLKTWVRFKEIDEIIVVDWDSDETIVPIIKKYQNGKIKLAIVKDQPSWILSQAYNLAARLTSRDKILKIDSDIKLLPGFFEKHKLRPNIFYSGNGAKARNENESHINGNAFFYRNDFFKVNGYNEYLKNYGWDDTNLYERLLESGMEINDFDFDTIYHIEHENRTKFQIDKKLFEKISDSEWERFNILKNRHIAKKVGKWDENNEMLQFQVDSIDNDILILKHKGDDKNFVDEIILKESEFIAIRDRFSELGIIISEEKLKLINFDEMVYLFNIFLENPSTFKKNPIYSLIKKLFYVNVDLFDVKKSYYAQLYIKSGIIDFNEKNSIKINITKETDFISFDLGDYDDITGLRFDPVNDSSELILIKIRLFSSGKIISDNFNIISNATKIINSVFYFIIDDPQIEIILPKNPDIKIDKLEVFLNYKSFGNCSKISFVDNYFHDKIERKFLLENDGDFDHKDLIIKDQVECILNIEREIDIKDTEIQKLQGNVCKLSETIEILRSENYEKELFIKELDSQNNLLKENLERNVEELTKFEKENFDNYSKIKVLEGELSLIHNFTSKLNEEIFRYKNSFSYKLLNPVNFIIKLLLEIIRNPIRSLSYIKNLSKIKESTLFDVNYYVNQNKNILKLKIYPYIHYLFFGGFEGLNPSPNFDSSLYLENNPDVLKERVNPLFHYIMYGTKEGRNLFSANNNYSENSRIPRKNDEIQMEDLEEFREGGFKKKYQLIDESGLFDCDYYLRQYDDVRSSHKDPLLHYILYGCKEKRNPNLIFDTQKYRILNELDEKINPLEDLIINGKIFNRRIGFNENFGVISEFGIERQFSSINKIKEYLPQRSHFKILENIKISLILPVYKSDITLLDKCIDSIIKQSYSNWELIIVDDGSDSEELATTLKSYSNKDYRIIVIINKTNQGISAATNNGVEISTGEFIAFIDHDDLLSNEALAIVVKYINENPDFDVFYSDQDKIDLGNKLFEPFFKPDWSKWYFRGVMYIGHVLVLKKSIIDKVGFFDSYFDGVQDFEYLLRVSENTQNIYHIPKILYHWRSINGSVAFSHDAKGNIHDLQKEAVERHFERLKINAKVEKSSIPHRLKIVPFLKENYPLVSIIIPTKDAPELIRKCLKSIFEITSYPNFELIIIDNKTTNKESLEILNRYDLKIVNFNEKFNFSKANNLGVKNSNGDYIIFLNNDIEIIEHDWIQQMLFFAEQPEIGAVGPLLTYSDDKVQHAGVVLGFNEIADHVLRNVNSSDDGYFGSLSVSREVSAVTAACLMMRKSLFMGIGQFNELYEIIYQDVDLCMKIREQGFSIIYTPNCRLIHHESKTRGDKFNFEDKYLFLDLWEDILQKGDPFYNNNFKLYYSFSSSGYNLIDFDKIFN